jgi:glucose-1-phosphate adenylyltransferase
MDYGAMLAEHVHRGADFTVGCIEVPLDEASAFGVMDVDADMRIRKFSEKPASPEPIPGRSDVALASMGIYVFNTQFLIDQLVRDAADKNSSHDFGKDIIPGAIHDYSALAYAFRDREDRTRQAYWRDVGTVEAFWKANLELLDPLPELNLYDADWPIWTYQEQVPPAKFTSQEGRAGCALDSMVSGGCLVVGATVRRSVLFSNVRVEMDSEIDESVLLPNVSVGRGCKIRRAVLDKGCRIPDGMHIGVDPVHDAERFHVISNGVVLVTRDMLGQSRYVTR